MIAFLHWFRWARVFASRTPLCPAIKPNWGPADAQALAAFYAGSTGRKLTLLTRFNEQTINASAISRPDGAPYNCGYAAGFRAHASWLLSLSANVPPHPDDDSPTDQGAPDLAEQLAP